ncbi:hypothetical protein Bcep18194_C7349 [Burkholderia lata]|uniref:Uncharacterized protein n=1 Tax=Burkholderia lata (strain ATCC 17760 / DSM 23089 / LMG 22485 / NCIMB 9086 / R18194 / 383) TaxID=482957 RepID=Q39MC3_BURL3|nr:hypothetical protein Bcep18194_C7349 [Burkholderia lata]
MVIALRPPEDRNNVSKYGMLGNGTHAEQGRGVLLPDSVRSFPIQNGMSTMTDEVLRDSSRLPQGFEELESFLDRWNATTPHER